jgi:hypothetical protein
VNRRSWPNDLGSPSGVGLQMYGGTSEPLVKAKAGVAATKAVRMIVWNCIFLILGWNNEVDLRK